MLRLSRSPRFCETDRMPRRLADIYLLFALALTSVLCLVTAPFFAPDEHAQSLRAVTLAHGQLLPTMGASEPGAQIDSGVTAAMDAVDTLRVRWEPLTADFHDRHYGPLTPQAQLPIEAIRWSGSRTFAGFGNTASYPPLFYLPAMAGWRIAEASRITVLNSLRLARWFDALTAVLLGWWALRIGGWPMLPVLLLPSTLFLEASSSQDAVMIPAAALAIALVLRALCEDRVLSRSGLALASILIAACAMARPPYLALGLLLFLPRWRRIAFPALAFAFIAAAAGLWRLAVAPFPIDTADEADLARQTQFLHTHPLAAAAALLRGTGNAAWDFVHRGLYVVGWNDLLPHHGAALVLSLCLLLFASAMPRLPLRGWLRWSLLCAAIAGPLLGLSLAEYMIWTPPGLRTVYGLQPRYWLPVFPAIMLLAACLPRPNLRRARNTRHFADRLLCATALALALVACTLPWMEAHAFYRTGLLPVLRLNWP